MSLSQIAQTLKDTKESIVLVYAFNATGKTRLSVDYKDATKDADGKHTGVYYNAFSEDIFVWDNDTDNSEANMRLVVNPTRLNEFHSFLTEEDIFKKLEPFNPKYDFAFEVPGSPAEIASISFYTPEDTERGKPIKISRGEERIFVWCFFLALFEIEGWAGELNRHFFIDDPVSSLDDHNIFVTASSLYGLIEQHHEKRRFIIATHHIGFFSILADWLRKGEKADTFKKQTKLYILTNKSGTATLENPNNDVFLYHLHLLQTLETAQAEEKLVTYHFALLRQVLENIASFLGVGRFAYVLEQIGIDDASKTAMITNALSHQKVYRYQTEKMNPDNEKLFKEVFEKIKSKYNFVLHAGAT